MTETLGQYVVEPNPQAVAILTRGPAATLLPAPRARALSNLAPIWWKNSYLVQSP
jgi:hypothetical protein